MILQFKGKRPTIGDQVFIEKSARIIGDVSLGDESSIWFNAVARGDINSITIGEQTNIQDGSVLHVGHGEEFALHIGNQVTVGHSVTLHGCTVEDLCLIGMGATVLDGAVIKKGCIVAAGSLVLQHQIIPEQSLVAGVPAKIKRMVTQEEIEMIRNSAFHYVELKDEYLKMNR